MSPEAPGEFTRPARSRRTTGWSMPLARHSERQRESEIHSVPRPVGASIATPLGLYRRKTSMSWRRIPSLLLAAPITCGCYAFSGSEGGGEVMTPASQTLSRGDVAVPADYDIEIIASHLTFPTSVTFDDKGDVYVTEAGYSYGEVFTVARLLRLREGEAPEVVASSNNGPWTGVTFHRGAFYVAEGGAAPRGTDLED
jgi:hypothetical protein